MGRVGGGVSAAYPGRRGRLGRWGRGLLWNHFYKVVREQPPLAVELALPPPAVLAVDVGHNLCSGRKTTRMREARRAGQPGSISASGEDTMHRGFINPVSRSTPPQRC